MGDDRRTSVGLRRSLLGRMTTPQLKEHKFLFLHRKLPYMVLNRYEFAFIYPMRCNEPLDDINSHVGLFHRRI